MPAPGGALWRGRPGKETSLPGPAILGETGAVLRRSGRPPSDCGTGPWCPRRESDGTNVHRRQVRGLPLPRTVPSRIRLATGKCFLRGWSGLERRMDHGSGPLCTSGQQAIAPGTPQLPPVSGPRVGSSGKRAGCGDTGEDRDRRLAGHSKRPGRNPQRRRVRLRAQRAAQRPFTKTALLLPPQPTKHLDRTPHPEHAGRRVPARRGVIVVDRVK